MLILPAEQQLNWKNPPVATLALILINCLVFFGYQLGDTQKIEQMNALYEKNKLLQYEAEPYLAYLKEHDKKRYREQNTLYEEAPEALGMYIMQDPGFAQTVEQVIDDMQAAQGSEESDLDKLYRQMGIEDEEPVVQEEPLPDEGIDLSDPEAVAAALAAAAEKMQQQKRQIHAPNNQKINFTAWRSARQEINKLQKQLSFFRFGLIPAEIKPFSFISHQFLHGGFMHLLGNMVFLFIVGFSIEIAIGRLSYVLFYLLSGMAGGVLFAVINIHSYLPLVGASGAVSGLMGMYLALYGLKRIRFFYWVAFYFNYFRAPALWILPIWIGKEIFEALTQDSQIAYSAHVGGMMVGYIALYGAKGKLVKVDEEYLEKIDALTPYREKKIRLNQLIVDLKFEEAKKCCEDIFQEKPDDVAVLSHYYHLMKLQPESDTLREVVDRIFSINKREHYDLIYDVYKDYSERTNYTPNSKTALDLVRKFLAIDLLSDAQALLTTVMKTEAHNELPSTMLLYAGKLAKTGEESVRIKSLIAYLQQHFPDAVESKQIAMLLNR